MATNAGQPPNQEGCVMQELLTFLAAVISMVMIFGSLLPAVIKQSRQIESAEDKIAMLEKRLSELEGDD